MTRGSHLDTSDWLRLLLWWVSGCGLSFSILVLVLHTVLEPELLAESSLRLSRSVMLVEEVLGRLPVERIPPGVLLISSTIPPEGGGDGLTSFDQAMKEQLGQRFGLRRELQRDRPPLADPWGGYWIRLQVPRQSPPLWLYQPERLSSSSAWFLPVLRGIALVVGILLGTIGFLRWRVEVPFTGVLQILPDTARPPLPLLPEQGIAPLRQLSIRINRLLERINDADKARRALIRGLVHDLAGPQTRLMLQVEGLERHAGPELHSTTRGIAADLQQLSRITEELGLLADQESPPARVYEFALDEFCHRLAASYPAETVTVTVRRRLIRIDMTALERALRNLIDNALEHGKPPVQLTAWVDRGVLCLVVEDHGAGILTPTLRTIAGPAPARDRGRQRHRGHGLEIVEGFCRDNGGALHLESSRFGGLRARITLRPTATNPLLL